MWCFRLTHSRCHQTDYSPEEVVRVVGTDVQVKDKRVLTADIVHPWMIVPYQYSVPPEFRPNRRPNVRSSDDDLLWWRAQLVYYILRPLPETWGIIRAAQKEACLNEFWPIIGIHSRQGSSVKLDGDGGRRKVYSSEEHLRAADELAKAIKKDDKAIAEYIFLSTEYEEEIHRIAELYPDRFLIHFAGTMQDLHSVLLDTGMTANERYKPYRELHLIAITHLFALLGVDGFICQLQSNYSRLVIEMLRAIGKSIPYVSVGGHTWMVDP